jgi:hypothetical protein
LLGNEIRFVNGVMGYQPYLKIRHLEHGALINIEAKSKIVFRININTKKGYLTLNKI